MIEEIVYTIIFFLSYVIPISISVILEKLANKKDMDVLWFILLIYNFFGIIIIWIINWNILKYMVIRIFVF